MCQKFFNGFMLAPLWVNAAHSERIMTPPNTINNGLAGVQYNRGFKPFSQLNGYHAGATQTYTPEPLGLLIGQQFGQPLIKGG